MKVYAPIWGCNLGDTLWVTPLARYETNLVVRMLSGDKRSRLTSEILRGVCDVELVEKTGETPKIKTKQHVTQQILSAYGHGGKPSIPFVKISEQEKALARLTLNSMGVTDFEKVIAITNHNSGSGDPTNYRAHYVLPPKGIIQETANFWLSNGYTVIQFGPSAFFHDKDPFDPIHGVKIIRGCSVRELAALYSVIGKFIGGDSGDYHLALACGAEVICLIPPENESLGYLHWDLLYSPVCWGQERPRVKYALHSDWRIFLDTEVFNP